MGVLEMAEQDKSSGKKQDLTEGRRPETKPVPDKSNSNSGKKPKKAGPNHDSGSSKRK